MCRQTATTARLVSTALLLLVWASPCVAQPAGSITLAFPVQTSTVAGDATGTIGIVSGSGSIEHWFAEERGRVFYEVSMDRFRASEAWDTWLHNAGAVRTVEFGSTTVSAGGAAFWRENSSGWSDASFHGVNLQSTVERALPLGNVSGGYNFYVRNFSDVPALDQVEHSAYARALLNLRSRTTLIGVVGAGWKSYDGDLTAVTVDTADQIGTQRRGRGTMLLRPIARYISDPSGRTLRTWTARLAQSLDDRTGIWIEHERRTAGGDAPPILVWTPPLFYDDGVYDDPYAIEAQAWRAGARHIWSRGDELAVRIDRSVRTFDGLDALDSDGLAIAGRVDTLWRSGADAEIVLRSTPLLDVVLLGGYWYVRNSSNDAGETYRSHIASAGLSIRF